jgi:sulfonate transport system substrate-binding protein
MNGLSRRSALAAGLGFAFGPTALRAAPAPLAERVELTVGHAKSAHTCPIAAIPDMLRPLGVDLKFVEFFRYADARTAVGSGSLDIATTAPGDILVLLSQGVTSVKAISGVGSSKKFVMTRKASDIPDWDALRGKRLGIPAGSAVWAQYAAAVTERNFPYDAPKNVNIQGGGPSFIQALQRGDVDAVLSWQPFESMMLVDKIGEFTTLDYSGSKAVGAELGLLCATTAALTRKKEAVARFFWAYATTEAALKADKAAYAQAIAAYTGVTAPIAASIADNVVLGGVVDAAQLQRQAKFFHEMGVLQKDVSGQVAGFWDDAPMKSASAA